MQYIKYHRVCAVKDDSQSIQLAKDQITSITYGAIYIESVFKDKADELLIRLIAPT